MLINVQVGGVYGISPPMFLPLYTMVICSSDGDLSCRPLYELRPTFNEHFAPTCWFIESQDITINFAYFVSLFRRVMLPCDN